MSYEFTPDEIKQVIDTARIFNPSFSEQQYQDSLELGRHLADSGYLEAVRSIAQVEKEKGIHCTEALDACKQLLADRAELEAEVASLQEKLVVQQDKNQQTEGKYKQIKEATEQAEEELHAVQTERQKQEKELIAFRKKSEREKERIDKEVEEYREKANVTKEEAAIAGQIKAQVESYGFSLELALDLSQEFAGHENARDELAEGLKEHQTLTNYIAALNEWAKGQKEALESELNKLKSEKDGRQAEIKNLEQARNQLQNILSQLQADVAYEEELRRFYHRYQSASWLMEYLVSWREIYFVRCNNPLFALTGTFDRSKSGARFCTEKPPIRRCPCCNYPDAVYDKEFYQTFNLPLGVSIKLQLGV